MNILYISSKKSWRGVASWMVKTALGLEERGHNVFLLSHPGSEINKLLPAGIKLIAKKLGPSYNPAMIVYLIIFIQKNKIDLMITNIDKEVAIGGIAARITGIPNIRRVGREDDFNNRFRSKWCHKLLVDFCIVPCRIMIDGIAQRSPWIDTRQFEVIYNGRDTRKYSDESVLNFKTIYDIPATKKILGITCQLSRKKHVDHLIKMFSKVYAEFPDWICVIAGSGPEEKNLKNLVKTLGIEDKVFFIGFVEDPMMISAIYDIAYSVSEIEGFPNSVVEYMATGRPVISTDVGGVREIIDDGINGFVIPFDDMKSLYNKTLELITDSGLRTKFSDSAIKTVEKSFTAQNMISRLEAFYLKSIS